MPEIPSPPLKGQKALVLGIANEHSIAYGCARAFRKLGRTGNHLPERQGEASRRAAGTRVGGGHFRTAGCPAARPVGSRVRPRPPDMGTPRHRAACDRLCSKGRLAGRVPQLFGGRVRAGHGRLLPFVCPHGPAGGPADDRGRHASGHDLSRRKQGHPQLRRNGAGEGRAGVGRALPRLRTGAAKTSESTPSLPARSRPVPHPG